MNPKKNGAVTAVAIANLIVAAFCGFAYVALTARMYMSTSWQGEISSYAPMAHSGWKGGLGRYFFSAVIALILQGVMWIFNFSVLGYLIEDYKKLVSTCAFIAALGYATTVGIACVLIWLSL
jgi:hypothetical protein